MPWSSQWIGKEEGCHFQLSGKNRLLATFSIGIALATRVIARNSGRKFFVEKSENTDPGFYQRINGNIAYNAFRTGITNRSITEKGTG